MRTRMTIILAAMATCLILGPGPATAQTPRQKVVAVRTLLREAKVANRRAQREWAEVQVVVAKELHRLRRDERAIDDYRRNQSALDALDDIPTTLTTPEPLPTTATFLGLTTTETMASVSLEWDDHPDPGLAFYNAHRATAPAGPYAQINTDPVLVSELRDPGLPFSTEFFYVVTAVDDKGFESEPSAPGQTTTTPARRPRAKESDSQQPPIM